MRDAADLLLSRPVIIPGVLFALAFGLHYNDYPTLAAASLGAGAGFFFGFTWGWLRGYWSGTDMDRACRGDP